MNSRNRLHVEFSNRSETIVAFSHDRGVLKTNAWGDYFFRGTTDNRFCCCSPELERKLIDMDIHAGERVGISKSLRNRVVTWHVRRLDAPSTDPPTTEPPSARANVRVIHTPIPDSKYAPSPATNEPPAPVFPEVDEPAPARHLGLTTSTPAPAALCSETAGTQHITASDNLLARCLCEAVDAVTIAQKYATQRGYAVAFGAPEVERIGVSIFIERTRNGAVYERKPAATQYVNAHAKAAEMRH
jgi:hypothetical protein